jgi:hypothetical protein
MDVVLGMSMSPSSVRMVVMGGENADGVIVETDNCDSATASARDQVVSAILASRKGADESGNHLTSIGVSWTDQVEATALEEALAANGVHNVMLVSAFLAAAALAQTVAQAIGYERIAMLFVEPESITVAVVDAGDGAVADVHKESLHGVDAMSGLRALVAGLEELGEYPQGLFVIGSGIDIDEIATLKTQLETATSLPVCVPEEPETALARGAALASANAPLFVSSTAALAYAQDCLEPDEDAEALTEIMDTAGEGTGWRRRPILLLGSAVVVICAVVAMEVALALGVRLLNVGLRPSPGQNLVVPTQQAPAPSAPASGPQSRSIPQPGPAAAPHPLNAPPAAPPPAAPPPPPVPAAPPVPVPLVVPAPVPPPQLDLNLPAPQPAAHPPASPPASQAPVSQPPVFQPPTHVPVAHPPTHIPVPQPAIHVPVPQPPVNVPSPPPPVHVPEPQPPVGLPAPEAPPVLSLPSHEAPPAPEAPAVPGLPSHEAPPAPEAPAPEPSPSHAGGDDVGGHSGSVSSPGSESSGGGSVGSSSSGSSSETGGGHR